DGILHLHGFHHEELVALLDGLSRRGLHRDDLPGHGGLEGARYGPARGPGAFLLLDQAVDGAAPEQVYGVPLADAVERLRAVPVAPEERARPGILDHGRERRSVDHDLQSPARLADVHLPAVAAAGEAHQRSLHGPRAVHGSGTAAARDRASERGRCSAATAAATASGGGHAGAAVS